ncbi:uncharacterized protein LOC131631237 [Vicia villosa]|uniref:uncharacterized protein LOC131631237 n=1 Tax=Vicia villosa TaxID=3911 RepID=UPI00273B8A92|nr:uncharacterized protein LOC131631237 [Vicia villosa]
METSVPVPKLAPPPKPPQEGSARSNKADDGRGKKNIRASNLLQNSCEGGISYRNIVTGEHGGVEGEEDEEEIEMLDQEELEGTNGDREGITVKQGKRGGYDCPRIILSKMEEKRIQRPWRRGVIVKLLGRKIGYKALENRLQQMWVRKGIIRIIDLGHDYYLVCFTHEEDKNAAMADGPWFIYDHYLTVKEWTPDFHPENDSIVNVAVWIRISGLPVEYYDLKVLQVIGNLVGRTVKVDKNTLQSERGKYARICVEVDISKPLLAMFELKDKSYRVEFEGLHLLCILCGKFGHYKEGCSLMKNGKGPTLSVNEQSHGVGTTSNGKKVVTDVKGQEDDPWQVVQKQRRIRKMPESKKKVPATGSWLAKAGSRFQALGTDMGETSGVVKESNNGRELNKENMDGIKIMTKIILRYLWRRQGIMMLLLAQSKGMIRQ